MPPPQPPPADAAAAADPTGDANARSWITDDDVEEMRNYALSGGDEVYIFGSLITEECADGYVVSCRVLWAGVLF